MNIHMTVSTVGGCGTSMLDFICVSASSSAVGEIWCRVGNRGTVSSVEFARSCALRLDSASAHDFEWGEQHKCR